MRSQKRSGTLAVEASESSVLPAADQEALYILAHAPGPAAVLAARGLLRAALVEWDLNSRNVASAATAGLGWLVDNVVRDVQAAGLPDALEISVRLVQREGRRYVRIEVLDFLLVRPEELGWPPQLTGLDVTGAKFGCHVEKTARRTWLDISTAG
ncbi:hypothetical protein [Actinomadura sp. 3N407]|uniref:hypothetical protein n=1 Tax=Actinomadura sp. 3N407 TaxID=3457423 RepID=UPI003FCC78E1